MTELTTPTELFESMKAGVQWMEEANVLLRKCAELLNRLGAKNAKLRNDNAALLHWGLGLAESLKQITELKPGCDTCNIARKLAREASEGER